MRLLIVQYAGDYRESFFHHAAGGGETYYAQRYSNEAIAQLAPLVEDVAVLCGFTAEPYEELLPNGVRAIGVGLQHLDFDRWVAAIAQYQPTHLILRTPIRSILRWAIQHQVPTLATFADSFPTQSLREQWRNWRLTRLLNHPQIQWVSNHGLGACEALQQMGVNTQKIVPWDWVYTRTPEHLPAKSLRLYAQPWTLLYVGSVAMQKGVGDAISATAMLRSHRFPVQLKIAGGGNLAEFQAQADRLGIADAVEFLGVVENVGVVDLMRSADLVLVPSRYDYPEGFPLVVLESLCARTPAIVSDHPMLGGRLRDGENAIVFRAGSPTALTNAIQRALTDPSLYRQISESALATWQMLQIPVNWATLIHRWVCHSAEDVAWLQSYSLASGYYQRSMQNQAEKLVAMRP